MRKKIYMTVMGICMAMILGGCGRNTQADVLKQDVFESIADEENSADAEILEEDEGTAEEAVEDIQEDADFTEADDSKEISAENLYWLEVLEEFEDSEYDLTAALTNNSLKDLCSEYFTLGVGINGSTPDNLTIHSAEYMAVAKKHFNSCTLTNLMKSAYILNQTDSQKNILEGNGEPALSFDCIDPTLEWCAQNGMKMRGHTLVWHTQTPEWFFREDYREDKDYVDKETMLFRMESYISQLMTHVQNEYPGVIYCWDVVNEAVDPDRGDKNSAFLCRTEIDGNVNPWYATIGEDYVEMAFTFARKYAEEDVKLFYNDYNTYQIPKRNAIYTLCESLKEKGLIDGIGMQGYWGIDYPDTNTLDTTIRTFAKLDLEIQITELSIGVDDETEENFEKQAKQYGKIFIMLHNLDTAAGGPANITNVTLFGLIDHYREGDSTNSRLFYSNYQPKPAFYKIYDLLQAMQ